MTSSELIEKLRTENLDQFFTLVRMHLSFVVDINTDDVECSTDKPKQFRWNFHKKTKNSNQSSSQNNINNMRKNEEVNSITEEGMLRLYELIDFLSLADNVIQEGIFRRTGSLSRQQELKQLLITGSSLGLDEGKFTVHDCASVLKGFLAELPQPLLMDQYYQTYCTLASQYPPNVESSETKLLTALQLLLLLLSPSHRSFLQRLLRLLRLVADNEASNRMSPDTLATMFTPHLLCPRKLSPEAFHTESIALSPLMSFMIRESARLWAPPAQLATDAAAYLALRQRRRALSPADLDESITDRTAANTVYTFVDRHRTRAENESNPTDTALAQLYAHIQALPDSSQKRRLIKHFNRQNGYGTPIQIQRTGKVAGSKSFGDSIKRHIFNKGLLNKTPKKGSGSSIHTVAEESIMTPRSRKPLIITSEQRDSAPETVENRDTSIKSDNYQSKSEKYHSKSETYQSKSETYQSKSETYQSKSDVYQSMSPKNDSDFVSSEDEMSRSSFSHERSKQSDNASLPRIMIVSQSNVASDVSLCTEDVDFVSSHSRDCIEHNTTLCEIEDIPTRFTDKKSLTGPFREYLLSRSVLTATPIDLSILNKSNDDEKISQSLLYCLDGNVPSDLTSSIGNLAVDSSLSEIRSPLKNINNIELSPNRKRSAVSVDVSSKVMKENEQENFKPRETEL